ncbi:hypothetical protein HMPREF1147_1926 [Selenomonas sp. FOBRC9]|nr:hypothetical protein HMPREF1147_1926 [Selenomonas sp. FOBRC9]
MRRFFYAKARDVKLRSAPFIMRFLMIFYKLYTRKKNICFLEKLLYFCYNCKESGELWWKVP